jgi:predicted PurR-regulated permease PerM
MISQLSSFLNEWPFIQDKIRQLLMDGSNFIIERYAISKEQQQQWLQEAVSRSIGQIAGLVQNALASSISSGILLLLVPVYTALLLYYRHQLLHFLSTLFPSEKKENILQLLNLTISTYYNFIKGMALVYLIVGMLNSIGLLLLGIPHAIFFGFVTSVLTFIPYIGIVIGSLLPIAMAWITFGSIWYPLGVVAIFALVQYLEANLIFPLAVSNRLNINPLATLLAITVGGLVWGVSGMILFVPFLAILKLIAERHRSMKAFLAFAGSKIA